jgi:hypothetical protein
VLTAGHAILLARLTHQQQEQALRRDECIKDEATLWDPLEGGPDVKEKPRGLRPVSVREMQAWIDKNVRFSADPDPMLFPLAALELTAAREDKRKVVAITFEHFIPDHAREGKTYFPASWKRADGEFRSKKCDHAVLGFVAVGPRRGEAFEVCISKETCEVHWLPQIRKRRETAKKRESAAAKGSGNSNVKVETKPDWKKQEEARQAKEAAYKKLRPAIEAEALRKVQSAPAGGGGPLAEILIGFVKDRTAGRFDPRVLSGKDPGVFLRFLAWQIVVAHLGNEYSAFHTVKRLGIDLPKLRKEAAAAEKAAAKQAPAKSKKGVKR